MGKTAVMCRDCDHWIKRVQHADDGLFYGTCDLTGMTQCENHVCSLPNGNSVFS
jgi:hypothetical protein